MSDDVEKMREQAEAEQRRVRERLSSQPRPPLPGDEDGDGVPDSEENKG